MQVGRRVTTAHLQCIAPEHGQLTLASASSTCDHRVKSLASRSPQAHGGLLGISRRGLFPGGGNELSDALAGRRWAQRRASRP